MIRLRIQRAWCRIFRSMQILEGRHRLYNAQAQRWGSWTRLLLSHHLLLECRRTRDLLWIIRKAAHYGCE